MILALDVGNTNIVMGCIENAKIMNIVRLRTDSSATTAEYAIKIREILELLKIDCCGFEGAIISSVVPSINASLSEAVKLVTGKSCMIVGPGMKTGLDIRIDDPGTLGCDLLVGAVATVSEYGYPAITIDMGTATTIFAIDKNGTFIGGAIMPGLKLSLAALTAGTSLLPDISVTAPKKVIGTNTVDCMRSGVVLGAASMIDGMVERFEKEIGEECKVIATGGLASSVVSHCSHNIICDDDLLLKGLWILYNKNQKKK